MSERRSRRSRRGASIATGLALHLAACAAGDDAGPASQAPGDFAGRWAFQVRATSTTCTGLAVPSTIESGYLVITQAGPALGVEHLDGCGALVYAAPGTVSGSVAVIAHTTGACVDSSCCYDVQVTETLALQGDALGGEVRLTLTASGCGTAVEPCDYLGAIAATRCAPADCQPDPAACP